MDSESMREHLRKVKNQEKSHNNDTADWRDKRDFKQWHFQKNVHVVKSFHCKVICKLHFI